MGNFMPPMVVTFDRRLTAHEVQPLATVSEVTELCDTTVYFNAGNVPNAQAAIRLAEQRFEIDCYVVCRGRDGKLHASPFVGCDGEKIARQFGSGIFTDVWAPNPEAAIVEAEFQGFTGDVQDLSELARETKWPLRSYWNNEHIMEQARAALRKLPLCDVGQWVARQIELHPSLFPAFVDEVRLLLGNPGSVWHVRMFGLRICSASGAMAYPLLPEILTAMQHESHKVEARSWISATDAVWQICLEYPEAIQQCRSFLLLGIELGADRYQIASAHAAEVVHSLARRVPAEVGTFKTELADLHRRIPTFQDRDESSYVRPPREQITATLGHILELLS